MNNVNLKHYIEILKKGGRITAKKYDDSELKFYINENGVLISEDEHGLDTDTGLSYIELYYVLESVKKGGDYIIEEDIDGETTVISENISSFEAKLERANLIGAHLSDNGYDLDDVYENYNKNQRVMQLIDGLSPEILDLLEGKDKTNNMGATSVYVKQNDTNILYDNLFNSGKIVIWTSKGEIREYCIDGGNLIATDNAGNSRDGFLAATQLKYDMDEVILGIAEAGAIMPEIVFKDEKAEERVCFGIDTARVFSARLGYSQEDFENEYENDAEFKYGIDSQDSSIWYRTETTEPVMFSGISRDALEGVTKTELTRFDLSISNKKTKENIDKGEL